MKIISNIFAKYRVIWVVLGLALLALAFSQLTPVSSFNAGSSLLSVAYADHGGDGWSGCCSGGGGGGGSDRDNDRDKPKPKFSLQNLPIHNVS